MRHAPLFSVAIGHEYLAGAPSPDLEISPHNGPDGARALARHRLIARPRPGELQVLAPLGADDKPVVTISDLPLRFDVRITGPDFASYTDTRHWPQHPQFRGTTPGPLVLAAGPPLPRDVVASIEIAGVDATWLTAPRRFTLELPATNPHWVFYTLTARPGDVLPEIRDDEPGRGITFTREPLADVDPALDPVGHRLAARNPGRRAFRFTSVDPVPTRRAARRQLALYLGGDLLLRELPCPSIHSPTTIRAQSPAEPRESLFRVIEY